jgi:hypothetical protein
MAFFMRIRCAPALLDWGARCRQPAVSSTPILNFSSCKRCWSALADDFGTLVFPGLQFWTSRFNDLTWILKIWAALADDFGTFMVQTVLK